MGTISEKLSYLNETKNAIKNAIKEKGQTISDEDTFRSYADKILKIEVGGGTSTTGNYLVQVIDYDGTVLKSQFLNTGDTFTLPDSPTHDRLVFHSWSSPINITDNTVTVEDSDLIIGATYTTASGLSEFDIELTIKTGLSVTLNMDGTKNWGDGTSDTATTHTYADYGEYIITCDGTTITSSSSSGIFGQVYTASTSRPNYYCKCIMVGNNITSLEKYSFMGCYSLTKVVISNGVTTIGAYAFQYCRVLKNIVFPNGLTELSSSLCAYSQALAKVVIPNGVTTVGSNVFSTCYSLDVVIFPDSITTISSGTCTNCHSLKSARIPNNITTLPDGLFYYCYGLKNITIPNGVTTITNTVFANCYSLEYIKFPNSVTSFTATGTGPFNGTYVLRTYDFSALTSIPTVTTYALGGISKLAKIYVPDDLYDSWITATNWTTYADYIYKASEMEN